MKVQIMMKDKSLLTLSCSWFSNTSTRFENDFLLYVPLGLSPCPENRKVFCKMSDILCFEVTAE